MILTNQAQRAQLIFLSLTIPLAKLTALTVKHMVSDTVPPLSPIHILAQFEAEGSNERSRREPLLVPT
jgi:hypothetical protein